MRRSGCLAARTAPSVAVVDDDMVARVAEIDGVTVISRSRFISLCQDADLRAAPTTEVEPDVAILLFTSGTTGEPKAAVLRHRHLTSYVISTVEFMSAEEDEAALVSVRAALPHRRRLRGSHWNLQRPAMDLSAGILGRRLGRHGGRRSRHPCHGRSDDAGPDP